MKSLLQRFKDRLFEGVSPINLGIFRMLVGLIFFIQMHRMHDYLVYELGQSEFFLTYDFFHWIRPFSEQGMEWMVRGIQLSAVLVMVGWFYRPAMAVLFLLWTYIFLIDNGHYNNHYYLMSLITFLMIFLRADQWGSLRQWIGSPAIFKKEGKLSFAWDKGPDPFRPLPYWQMFVLQFQVGVVYFYGGIAKMNWDWLHGYPLKIWLPGKDMPFFQEFYTSEFGAMVLSYGGVLFDLGVPVLLFSKKLRKWALPPIIMFHISNHFLWNIGIFPWFMLFGTIIFFTVPPGKFPLLDRKISKGKKERKKLSLPMNFPYSKLVTFCLGAWMAWQLLFPFRGLFYRGPDGWTGMGWDFSWNMMLVDKGYATKMELRIPDEGVDATIDILKYISPKQFKHIGHNPRHFVRLAHQIHNGMKEKGLQSEAEIYVYTFREYNGRPFQLVVDTTKNLLDYEYTIFETPDFIMPFEDLPYEERHRWLTPEERKMFGIR